ncbi:F-box/kelch-repeat protein At3g23880-like [Rhododendron vialii]|uniref:F-box/kelch-repeat protein At3g23880-like n=1 Tax=Rhododendron vialii TaxID=182163 RepID=UPI00265D8913|nr:F-box/kelch-repeat protein At3g23880-like [Rhododendron vialii]
MEGSQSIVGTTAFKLPFEMTIEILSRLPVKSLLRFKSVCKTWYDLIKTPHFISKHLLTHSTRHHTPLLETSLNLVTENQEISLIYNDGFNNGPINLDFPFLDIRDYRRTSGYGGENYLVIAGICNGLVCVSLSCFGYRLFLCNPSTRKFREIPNSEWNDENSYGGQVSFGFGFHPSANDYKLIRIGLYSTPTSKYNIRADLYIMSTDTWTEIDFRKLSLFLGEMNEGGEYDSIVQIGGSSATALNGVFYWPARVVPTDQVVVMSFDMGTEVFSRIRTPECLHERGNLYNWQFTELDDKIALVISHDESGFDVWVLNENESCWTNQIKVGPFPRIASDMGYEVDGHITAVGGGKNGELLVTEHKYTGELKLFSYDTKTRETMDLYCGPVWFLSFVYLYAGTLLPVMQANEIALNK